MNIKKKPDSCPPFLHSGKSLNYWYMQVILGVFPLFSLISIYNFRAVPVALISTAGFLAGEKLPHFIFGDREAFKVSLFRYILWGLFFTVFTCNFTVSLMAVFFASFFASVAAENVAFFKRSVLPPFVIALILVYSFVGVVPAMPEGRTAVLFAISAGVIWLIIKRKLPIQVFAGIACAAVLAYIITAYSRISAPALLAVVLSYPGLVPERIYPRFLFGLASGFMVIFFGVPGFLVSLLLNTVI